MKADVTTWIICIKGTMRGKISLTPYITNSPSFIIILPNQILEYEHISEDFSWLFIIMPNRFTIGLNFEGRLPLFLSVRNNPIVSLTDDDLMFWWHIIRYFKGL
jgi:AraC family transcriptional regulator, transcriptional activator of pobA